MKPLGRNVIIQPIKHTEEKTAGGIITIGSTKNRLPEGTVLAVSEDIEAKLQPGDKVLYNMGAGNEVVFPVGDAEVEALLMDISDVRARVSSAPSQPADQV